MTAVAPGHRPRGVHERGPAPLSAKTRRRLLNSLLQRAENGDIAASEALIRLADRAGRRRYAFAEVDGLAS